MTLLTLFSCSTNPKSSAAKDPEELLIEKPQINYKLNSLPKDINVIYFSNSSLKIELPDEVVGFLANYYSFSKLYNYFPKINFINLKKNNSCNFIQTLNTFNLFFLLDHSFDDKFYESCMNKITSQNTLFIVNSYIDKLSNAFRYFIVDRNEDKHQLVRLMSSYNDNIIIIDNEITKDKYEIGSYLRNNFNIEAEEYVTFDKEGSSEILLSKLFLSEQSNNRKRKLSRIISKNLEHNSRTREDLDAIFLSVGTQEARGLKPAIDYSNIENMEVFLANDWNEDILFMESDKDLERVISIDIPFMLPVALPKELNGIKKRTRNFATGYDSFQILLLLKGSRNLNKTIYKGLTGKITFKDKVIQRKSTIFKIEDGAYEYLN